MGAGSGCENSLSPTLLICMLYFMFIIPQHKFVKETFEKTFLLDFLKNIYLAAPGLSHGAWDLQSSLRQAGSQLWHGGACSLTGD